MSQPRIDFNGHAIRYSNNYLYGEDPYNPLRLPPFTMRIQLSRGAQLPSLYPPPYMVCVDQTENIWDITPVATGPGVGEVTYLTEWKSGTFPSLSITKILGANSTGVTNMYGMMENRQLLSEVALFDTSSVTNFGYMFASCTSVTQFPTFDMSSGISAGGMFSGCWFETAPDLDTSHIQYMSAMFDNCKLKTVPLYSTASAIDTVYMFRNCRDVESGILDLYNQASSQSVPPAEHGGMFYNCGIDTVSGQAELDQIPADWKNYVEI